MCASTHFCSVFGQFPCYFFAICDSDEHILQYGCCYHTVYMGSNCCLSVYSNLASLRWGPGKMLLESWKVLEFFETKSGNAVNCCCIQSDCSACSRRGPTVVCVNDQCDKLLDSQTKEASVLWSHHEETRELPGERDNARNNARCTQARKTTHGLGRQHQDVDRTPRGRVRMTEDRDKWRKYVYGVANPWIQDS